MSNKERRIQYTIPLPERLVDFLKNKSAHRVLDVGCGCGRSSFFLRDKGYEVIGIDIAQNQVKLAQKEIASQAINEKIGFVINDAQKLCFPDLSFDAAAMLGIITLVSQPERSRIVNEVHRVVKPSGYVFVEEFGRTWNNPVYAKRYKDDFEVTGELGTITLKDATGRILHFGHHFTRKELLHLFKGFHIIEFDKDTFISYYHRNWVNGYTILAQKITQ